ncbi:MAG TPA: GNAT family N-acetyltransferase [Anaerolineaceae bacterium]|nr:GNAT family N-acetyltransferase [Anaerolineaceae bacterium]
MIFRRPIPLVRPAVPGDRAALTELIQSSHCVHKHLDWRPALDWLDSPPFLVLARGRTLLAALACPPEPPDVAWLRLFAVHPDLEPAAAWRLLYPRARQILAGAGAGAPVHPIGAPTHPTGSLEPRLAAVALQPWLSRLLADSGFEHHQDIVTLEWEHPDTHPWRNPPPWSEPTGGRIRVMQPSDLTEVAAIDQAAFEPLWRNSLADVRRAYDLADYATVAAATDGTDRILGFQISTANSGYAHLARLATRTDCQRQGVGLALVRELLAGYSRNGIRIVTVNTQSTNQASLALYRQAGFRPTGEDFPVWLAPLAPPAHPDPREPLPPLETPDEQPSG